MDANGWWAPAPHLAQTRLGPVEMVRQESGNGRGQAVLALHGGMGGFDQGLLLAHSALAETAAFDVIAPSRPGYLGTPFSGRGSPEAQAELHAALLDALGIGRVLVIAVSAGGPSALAFAARHPERCAGLVLISACTGRLDVPARVRMRIPVMGVMGRVPGFSLLMEWVTASQPEKAARASILDGELCARTLADPEAGPLMRALQESVFRQMRHRLPGTLTDVETFAALPEAPPAGISTPTFLLHGTGDRVVPFAHALRAVEAMPQAELMTVEDGEHVCLFTHLRDVRRRIGAFMGHLDAR